MRRHRRFPLLSLLVVLAVGAGIGYMTFLDVDVPARPGTRCALRWAVWRRACS